MKSSPNSMNGTSNWANFSSLFWVYSFFDQIISPICPTIGTVIILVLAGSDSGKPLRPTSRENLREKFVGCDNKEVGIIYWRTLNDERINFDSKKVEASLPSASAFLGKVKNFQPCCE